MYERAPEPGEHGIDADRRAIESSTLFRRRLPLLLVLTCFVGFLIGCWTSAHFASRCAPYTIQLIAPGAGAYVISQRTGRIYAVETYGQAEYVADISEWDNDPHLRPGVTLRHSRMPNASPDPPPSAE